MNLISMDGPELLKLSDDDLGLWLVSSWLHYHAEKKGIPEGASLQEWAIAILTATGGMDSDSVKNAAMESMFRKACAGDFKVAGGMLRKHLHDRAHQFVLEKHAKTGMKVRKPYREANRARHTTAEDRDVEMQKKAAAKWAEPQHKNASASAIARMIDPEHHETTRRKLKKPQP